MITQEKTAQEFQANFISILNDAIAIHSRELDSLILAREEVPAQYAELSLEIAYVQGKIDQAKSTIRTINIYA